MTADAALQNLVAELAETTPEDMAAVLAMLDPASAVKVRGLLAAYLRVGTAEQDKVTPLNTAGLSDWLAARVIARPSDDLDTYRMTPHAIETLRALSASVPRLSAVEARR